MSNLSNFTLFARDIVSGMTLSGFDTNLTKEIDRFRQGKIRNKLSTHTNVNEKAYHGHHISGLQKPV